MKQLGFRSHQDHPAVIPGEKILRRVACFLPALLAGVVAAQGTITVCQDGSCDFTSIQDAIDSIGSGDSGEILVHAGTYTEGPINFGGIAVTIRGVDGPHATILRQDGTSRVMRIQSGNSVVLDSLTIADGNPIGGTNSGGGIKVVTGGALEMYDCIIRDNQTSRDGGGVFVADGATAKFTGCLFQNNVIAGSTVPRDGGGLFLHGIDGNTIDRCFFEDNIATGNGGGLFQGRASQAASIKEPFPQLRNSAFTGNIAGQYGGGAHVLPALIGCEKAQAIGYVTNCTFNGNSAGFEGAIIGQERLECGKSGTSVGPSIFVINSIIWENGPAYLGSGTRWLRCAIDVLDQVDSAVECNDIYTRFLYGGGATGFDEFRVWNGSPVIDSGRSSILGVPIEFGAFDLGGRARVEDDPFSSNLGSPPVDIGAHEYSTDFLDEAAVSIWTGGSEPALLVDPTKWHDGLLPTTGRTWILDEVIYVSVDEDLELGQVALASGALNFDPSSSGLIRLGFSSTAGAPLVVGFHGGQSISLSMAEDLEIEASTILGLRGRIHMNGGTLTTSDAIHLTKDEGTSGGSGVRTATLHGPGTIRGATPPGELFDPVFNNEGRVRVDGLITVEGDYRQQSGAIRYQHRLGDGFGLDRRVDVTGMASLGGSVVFDIQPGSWDPQVGSSYTILNADGGFVAGEEMFDVTVTQWYGDPRFFVLSTVENASGPGMSVIATVATLDALVSNDEALDTAGIALEDMLLIDVDMDGAKDLVLSVDTGASSDGQVIVLRNEGVDSSGAWQGFESFASVTGFTVGQNPRGLDAGFIDVGRELSGANFDILVANEGSGTVSVLRNESTPGSVLFTELQTIEIESSENPRPVDICVQNLDMDTEGYSDLVVTCLDGSVWTFQNTIGQGGLAGSDPLSNGQKQEREKPITRFTPGLGGGGGKRDTDPPDTNGTSEEGDSTESGSVSLAHGNGGIILTWTTYQLPAGSEPLDITRADLDGDGIDDLVTANSGDDAISILFGFGLGAYQAPITIPLDAGYTAVESISAGDLDGDGDIDLVFVCTAEELEPGSGDDRVTRIVRNALVETGSFCLVFDETQSLRGQEPYLVRTADVDSDGVEDVIALTAASGSGLANGPMYGIAAVAVTGDTKVECLGDLNEDGIVGGADLALLLGGWGPCDGATCIGDFDENGQVNGADLALLLGAWGPCGSAAD